MGSVYAYFHHLANIILKQTIFVVNGHDFIGLNVFIINNRLSLSLSLSLSEQLKLFPLRQHLAYRERMYVYVQTSEPKSAGVHARVFQRVSF